MKFSISERWSRCKNFDYLSLIKDLHVEPIVFLVYVAGGLAALVNQIGTYRIICIHALGTDNEYFNCLNPASSKYANYSSDFAEHFHEAETKVQQANTFWSMMFKISYTIPALFGDSILTALGDRYGRKVNILIGITGILISYFPHFIIFTFNTAPLYMMVVFYVFASLTGFQSIVNISFYAYLADTVVDKSNLTIRMSMINVFTFASSLFTPLLSARMMAELSYAQATLVTYSIYVASFFLAMLILKQIPPVLMRKMMLEKYIKKHGHAPREEKKEASNDLSIVHLQ